MQTNTLATRTLRGIAWAYAAFFGKRVFTFFSTAILARLLVPDDFGLVGFALLILNFIEVARGFGINEAVVYNRERIDETNDTAFWINTGVGVLQMAVTLLLAPLFLSFFDDPRLVDILRVLAISFVITALGQTHSALLQKELLFRRRFVPDLISSLLKGLASIALAWGGLGVWSLVIGHLVGVSLQTITLWAVVRWRPRLRFFSDRARSLWHYGVHILIVQAFGIALDQADQLMIGTLLGQTQLGYYTIASKIPELIIANFSLVLTTVLFPALAKLNSDRGALIEGFLATTRYTALVTFGAGFGLAAVAPELVRVVYGAQWDPAIDLFRVLALLGIAFTIPWAAGDALKAIGRPDVSSRLLFIEALYTFPLIWVFTWQTRMAVMASFANLIAALITAVLRLMVTSRVLKLDPRVFLRLFRAPLAGGTILFAAVSGWRWAAADLPALLLLGSAVPVGAAVYLLVLWVLERPALLQGYAALRSVVARQPADSASGVASDPW